MGPADCLVDATCCTGSLVYKAHEHDGREVANRLIDFGDNVSRRHVQTTSIDANGIALTARTACILARAKTSIL